VSKTFILRNTNSDLSVANQLFGYSLLDDTATAGTFTVNLGNQATLHGYAWTDTGVPGTDGATGSYSVEVYVNTANTDITMYTRLARVNSSGTVQTESDAATTQSTSAGLHTFNFTDLNLGTWASGDRLRVQYTFINASHGNQSCQIQTNTTDTEVATPYVIASETVMDASPGSYGVTGQAAGVAHNRTVNASSGSNTITGMAATLAAVITLSASPGSYAVDGADATPLTDRVMEATAGEYTVTGADANALFDRFSNAEPGSYTKTGVNAELTNSTGASLPTPYFIIKSDNTKVSEAVTNLYFDLSLAPAEFWERVVDGGDIRVYRVDTEAEVAREVVGLVIDSASGEGSLFFNSAGLSTSADTEYAVHFGDSGKTEPAANSTYGSQNVWDANYAAVWHKYDATTSSISDSTANGNTGTKRTTNAPLEVDGKLGKAQDYVRANNDRIDATKQTTSLDITGNNLTVSVWAKNDVETVSGAYHYMFGTIPNDGTTGYSLNVNENNQVRMIIGDGTLRALSRTISGGWNVWNNIRSIIISLIMAHSGLLERW
jgi:hypothetical protein